MHNYINFSTILDAGDGKHLNIQDNFPQIPNNQNIGVFFSGGMESTLLALICKKLYGIDRIKLIYSDHLFTNSKKTKDIIKSNVLKVSKYLDIPAYYIHTSKEKHIKNAKENVLQIRDHLIENFNCYYSLLGFSSLFWDLEDFIINDFTDSRINEIIENNPKKYKNLMIEYRYDTGKHIEIIKNIDIHVDTYEIIRNNSLYRIMMPFDSLNKNNIVHLYKNLDLWDFLINTESCVDDYGHCGSCFACQQRHDAFVISNENDITNYKSDYVRENSNVH